MQKTIGIIGFGTMGSAIAQRICVNYKLTVFDQDKNKISGLTAIEAAENIFALVNKVEVVILAVKPQDFDSVLNEMKCLAKGKLIISIAAGITARYIENKLGNEIRVIRVMPNLPAKIGQGTICLAKGKYADKNDLKFADEVFKNLGVTFDIDEEMMNAATAVSGSGPGFFFALIENKPESEWEDYGRDIFAPKLARAALDLGFNPDQADLLAVSTIASSLALLRVSNSRPHELLLQVASKGGTTEAGLKVLRNADSLPEAVNAALKRAQELSNGG